MGDDRRVPQALVGRAQSHQDSGERIVLTIGKRSRLAPLELDPYRKIVAVRSPLPGRTPGMPSPFVEGDELDRGAVAQDQQVSGDSENAQLFLDPGEVRQRFASEQGFGPRRAELPWWKTDAVNDDEFRFHSRRT